MQDCVSCSVVGLCLMQGWESSWFNFHNFSFKCITGRCMTACALVKIKKYGAFIRGYFLLALFNVPLTFLINVSLLKYPYFSVPYFSKSRAVTGMVGSLSKHSVIQLHGASIFGFCFGLDDRLFTGCPCPLAPTSFWSKAASGLGGGGGGGCVTALSTSVGDVSVKLLMT